jgi:hypothetical protein
MPTKNFFLSHPSLAPAHSPYQFLYTTQKTPIPFSSYVTSMSLNCSPSQSCLATGMLLNCHASWPSSGTMLNCRTLQTMHNDMSSSHLRHLRHWTYSGMPSSLCIHLRHLGHPGHLGHLGYLSIIGNLDILNPYPLTTTLIDDYHRAFITEMDPNDPGPSEGYFANNLLNPLSTATHLLPDYYTSQTTLNGHSPDIPLDALDGHSSLSEIHKQIYDLFALDPYNSLIP